MDKIRKKENELLEEHLSGFVAPEHIEEHLAIIREKADEYGQNVFHVARGHVDQIIDKL